MLLLPTFFIEALNGTISGLLGLLTIIISDLLSNSHQKIYFAHVSMDACLQFGAVVAFFGLKSVVDRFYSSRMSKIPGICTRF